VDSLAPTAFVESEIVNDNWVAAESEIITETPSKGDAWIRKRSHPC
jgi:1,2-phenylacetyl-CoA epoxidase PaaB subunit